MEKHSNDARNSERNKMSLVVALKEPTGELMSTLDILKKHKVNVRHIETRKSRERDGEFEAYVDIESESGGLDDVVRDLRKTFPRVTVYDDDKLHRAIRKTVSLDKGGTKYFPDGIPWFPRKIQDLDISANRVLLYGDELDADHPGFKDAVYRKRRKYIGELAFEYTYGHPIPIVEYTEEETRTWSAIYNELMRLYPTHASKEYLVNWPLLKEHCGYREENIPQLEVISKYLREKTGFTLRPVAGYLSSRDFLAGLAFRVFHCTQYIRHSSDPFYTPEPDCCHELLGHMPLFLDAEFAEFSQEIGLASLGASDEQVAKLATCYFFTVEFGLCKESGDLKVYGAGLLSSADELKHVLSSNAIVKRFDPETACNAECMITTYQQAYFYTDTFEEAKNKLRKFAKTLSRPFEVRYNPYTQTVDVLDRVATLAMAANDIQEELAVLASAIRKIAR